MMSRTRAVMRIVPVLSLALGMTACFQIETIVKVRADGSGTLVETMTMNPKAMEGIMNQIGKEMGGSTTTTSKTEKTPFSLDKAKAKAKEYGEGVTFVSAEPIDRPDAKGMRATYAFKDITKLRISEKPQPPMGEGGPPIGGKGDEKLAFHIDRLPNGDALLRINMGEPPKFDKPKQPESKEDSQPMPPEAMAMMKQMFNGMRIAIIVEVEGKVVKTNSPYLNGSAVTLLDVDFANLMQDENRLKQLQAASTMAETKAALQGIKGIKINLEPEVQVEFAGR